MDKKGRQTDPMKLVVIGVLIFLGYQYFTGSGMFAAQTTAAGTPETPIVVSVEDGCDVADTTLTLGPQSEHFNPTTAITAGSKYILYQINGVTQNGGTPVADSTTTTVSPGDKIELVYAYNSSEDVAAGTGYTPAYQEFTVPCSGAVRSAAMDGAYGDAHQIYDNADLTGASVIKCFNTDNDVISSTANPLDLTAGDVVTINCQIQGIYEDAYSPAGNILMAIEYNSSAYDAVELVGKPKLSCPSYLTVHVTENTIACFDFGQSIISNEKVNFDLLVDTKSTGSFPENQTRLYLEDQAWYLDDTDSKLKLGYEDMDGGNVGTTANFVNETIYTT